MKLHGKVSTELYMRALSSMQGQFVSDSCMEYAIRILE